MLSADRKSLHSSPATPPGSPALEWLWRYLHDGPRPHILDCGPVRQSTVEVLLRRGATLYIGDLITPLVRGDSRFWNRNRKVPVFRADEFLAELPSIPPGSLSAVFCWQLMDLVPHDALATVILRLHRALRPGGVLFCLLREPRLNAGADAICWLENLTTIGRREERNKPFPYPAVTNREMERLVPTGSIKTFLTRSGMREVLAVK